MGRKRWLRPCEACVLTMIIMGTLCLTLGTVGRPSGAGQGEVSAFGARFDVETDAAMLAFSGVAVAALGIAGCG